MNSATVIKSVLLLLLIFPSLSLAESEGALTLSLGRQKLYQGESTTASVTLLLPGNSIKNLQLPKFDSSSGISASGFSLADQQEQEDGTRYRFSATITAKLPGDLPVGPVSITGEYLSQASGVGGFFGETGSKRVTLLSDPVTLHVAKLPEKGRPAGFDSAVGVFHLSVTAAPAKLSPGEPVMVTTVISGHGNFRQFGCPPLPTEGFRSYPAVLSRSGSSLICQQLVIPDSAGPRYIAPVKFSFFNTSTASYRTLQSSSIPVTVNDVAAITPLAGVPPLTVPSAQPGTVSLMGAWFVVVAVFAAVGALLYFRFVSNPIKFPVDPGYFKSSAPVTEDQIGDEKSAAALVALLSTAESAAVTGDHDLFYFSVRRGAMILQNADPGNSSLKELIDRCDAVRYGLQPSDSAALQQTLQALKKLVCSA